MRRKTGPSRQSIYFGVLVGCKVEYWQVYIGHLVMIYFEIDRRQTDWRLVYNGYLALYGAGFAEVDDAIVHDIRAVLQLVILAYGVVGSLTSTAERCRERNGKDEGTFEIYEILAVQDSFVIEGWLG